MGELGMADAELDVQTVIENVSLAGSGFGQGTPIKEGSANKTGFSRWLANPSDKIETGRTMLGRLGRD
jgi:hypothetical protein